MHILIVASFTLDEIGGAGVVVEETTKRLVGLGHEVTHVSFSPRNQSGLVPGEVPLYRYRIMGGRPYAVLNEWMDVWNPRAVRYLKRVIRIVRPDVVHFHNFHGGTSVAAARAVRRMGVPCVATLHDYWAVCVNFRLTDYRWVPCDGPSAWRCLTCRRPHFPYQVPVPFRAQVLHGLMRNLSFVCLPSHFARDFLVDCGYDGDLVRAVYNGVDADAFRPPETKPQNDPVRILYVGRTSFKKGITFILDACDELHRDGVRFVLEVVGGIREFVSTHRDYPFAEFTGEVSREGLPECFQRSDVFVQPAITYETFGLSVAEAMACELPVVVTRMGGMVEVAGDAGIVVEPRNVPEMKAALKQLIEDPELRANLGRRGRERMLEKFTWERCVEEYMGLYGEAVAGKSG